jgi:putative oxidoreductase
MNWFDETLILPFPINHLSYDLNWTLAWIGEISFGVLLVTPLWRLAALGLLWIDFVAIYSVHFPESGWLGFNSSEEGGWELPFLYGLSLVTLLLGSFRK